MDRRTFLRKAGAGAIALPIAFGDLPVFAFRYHPLLAALGLLDTDRVLVLVQLNGGNDGLNTIVPYEDDLYYQMRPTLAIRRNQVLPLGSGLGFHSALEPLRAIWDEGDLAIVQSVGYPNPNLSHFRSTDIWLTGSDGNTVLQTGWLGRYLGQEYPDFPQVLPSEPLAIQIGAGASLAFHGPNGEMVTSLSSPDEFYQIVGEGSIVRPATPDTPAGRELEFLYTLYAGTYQYASVIKRAADRAQNRSSYDSSALARSLAIVARLIAGGLGTRLYLVQQGGYDTHAAQANTHTGLLRTLAAAIRAFYEDLRALGLADRVLLMTFSEFGRRPRENGSAGTDHGTAAPMFLVGRPVRGGILGPRPDLRRLDNTGNLFYHIDFRQVYSTLLGDWFGLRPELLERILLGRFEALPLLTGAATGVEDPEQIQGFRLDPPWPNPADQELVIRFHTLGGHVVLRLFDVTGRELMRPLDGAVPPGWQELRLSVVRLPAGAYFCQLLSGPFTQTRKFTVAR
ncbi:MAG: DUF1501 domain-containing protein [Bacteroidota bacterium]|nr:DUF1501 domain-containing protein [Bacteroidota bacterium]MDW8137170.1 DUF1501 domain-containing protein [Bacteroidota bacterium]